MPRKQSEPPVDQDLFDRIVAADFGRGGRRAETALLDRLVESEDARRTHDEVDTLWQLLGTVEPEPREDAATDRGRWFRPAWAFALAACLVMALGLTWLLHMPGGERSFTIDTGQAERRIARLDDGSTVELSAQSSVTVRYSEGTRRIDLNRGEALFQVAHDTARPFIVGAAGGEIRAVGTAFNVRLGRKDVVVTVVEGTVRVSPRALPAALGKPAPEPLAEFVRRGEQVSYQGPATAGAEPPLAAIMSVPRPVDVAGATAWTRGMLEFQGVSLGEVIDELNRHSPRRIALLDPRFEQVKVYGLLRAGDPESLVELLRDSEVLRGRDVETILKVEQANE